jgi:thioredoxin reductase (NADPH)
VILIHRRDRFRAQKAIADRVLHNPNIQVRFNTMMKEIKGEQKAASVVLEKTTAECKPSGETSEEAADAVFIFTGTDPQAALVPDVKKDEAGYIITDQNMASSLPGLYAAGDVRATPFRQVVVAAAEGAIAAHSAAAYIDGLRGQAY